MTTNNYLTDRVDDQIDWYDKKSSWNQRMFKQLQILQIVAAASIPFLTGFITSESTEMVTTLPVLYGLHPPMRFEWR